MGDTRTAPSAGRPAGTRVSSCRAGAGLLELHPNPPLRLYDHVPLKLQARNLSREPRPFGSGLSTLDPRLSAPACRAERPRTACYLTGPHPAIPTGLQNFVEPKRSALNLAPFRAGRVATDFRPWACPGSLAASALLLPQFETAVRSTREGICTRRANPLVMQKDVLIVADKPATSKLD